MTPASFVARLQPAKPPEAARHRVATALGDYRRDVDLLLAGAGMFLLVFPLAQGHELGWPAWVLAMLAASVAVLGGFGWYQVRRKRAGRPPLIVAMSGTGWPGRAGVNLTGLLSTLIGTPHRDRYCDGTSDSLTAPATSRQAAAARPA